jgi:hypothetical protein
MMNGMKNEGMRNEEIEEGIRMKSTYSATRGKKKGKSRSLLRWNQSHQTKAFSATQIAGSLKGAKKVVPQSCSVSPPQLPPTRLKKLRAYNFFSSGKRAAMRENEPQCICPSIVEAHFAAASLILPKKKNCMGAIFSTSLVDGNCGAHGPQNISSYLPALS